MRLTTLRAKVVLDGLIWAQLSAVILLVVFSYRGITSAGYTNIGIVHLNKAQVDSTHGVYAERDFQQAILWNPANVQARRNLGYVYSTRGEWTRAACQFEKELGIEPLDVLTHYALASVYEQQGWRREALQELELARAWKSLRAEYAEQGLALLDAGKPAEAERELRNLIDLAEKSDNGYWVYWRAQGYQWLGRSLEQQGRQAEAVEAYQMAILLGREHGLAPRTMVDLAYLYAGSGRLDQSVELLNNAILLAPDDRYIPLSAGDLWATHHDYLKAIEYYQLAARITPADGLPWQRIAECHIQRGDIFKAIDAAQRGIEQNEQSSALHYVLGRAYLEVGNKVTACQEFQAALNLSPADATLRQAVADVGCP